MKDGKFDSRTVNNYHNVRLAQLSVTLFCVEGLAHAMCKKGRNPVGGNPSVTFQESSVCATHSMKSNLSLPTKYNITNAHDLPKLRRSQLPPALYKLVVARIIREIRGEEGTANISPEAAVVEAVGVGGKQMCARSFTRSSMQELLELETSSALWAHILRPHRVSTLSASVVHLVCQYLHV